MSRPRPPRVGLGILLCAWAAYAVWFVLYCGDIGFVWNDWSLLMIPHKEGFFDAVRTYAGRHTRPLEGLYLVTLHKVFGFNGSAFHLISLLLLALDGVLLARCIIGSFPTMVPLALASAWFAFLLPVTASLTFMMQLDHSRLSMAVFLCSVLAFQRWAGRQAAWKGLLWPALLYYLSTLVYDGTSFLIFSVPFFVWPILKRLPGTQTADVVTFLFGRAHWTRLAVVFAVVMAAVAAGPTLVRKVVEYAYASPSPFWAYLLEGRSEWPLRAYQAKAAAFFFQALAVAACGVLACLGAIWSREEKPGVGGKALLRLITCALLAFSLYLSTRLIVFRGGIVPLENAAPPLQLLRLHAHNLFLYLAAPFREIPADGTAIGFGVSVLLVFVAVVSLAHSKGDPGRREGEVAPSRLGVATLALAFALLGYVPYLLAGYAHGYGYFQQPRIFSMAGFGLAILPALFAAGEKSPIAAWAGRIPAGAALGMMAVFQVALGRDWRHAADLRRNLFSDLVRQAPDVEPGTTLLFLDLQHALPNGIPVVGATDGLRDFVRILYNRDDINAHFLYPYSESALNSESRIATKNPAEGLVAVAMPEGVVARRGDPKRPSPHDSLLVFRREGGKLILMDSLLPEQRLASIRWEGASAIRSNPARIRPASENLIAWRRECCPESQVP